MPGTDEPIDSTEFFAALVGHFYERVATDSILRPMYPADLGPAKERLTLFLRHYFVGDPAYEQLRGHPRLRMRHARFRVDQAARDAWVTHIEAALEATLAEGYAVPAEDVAAMREYFSQTATFLMNSGGLSIAGR